MGECGPRVNRTMSGQLYKSKSGFEKQVPESKLRSGWARGPLQTTSCQQPLAAVAAAVALEY